MEHDEQTSTPNKSEGSARKKFKRLRHKVTAGKLFYSDEDEQESYSILELYRTEYEAAQLENQAAQTQPQDQAAQTQPHDQGPHDQAPQDQAPQDQDTEPQDEAAQDQNTEPQDHNQAEDDRDHNQNEQESQEEAQNEHESQNEQKADNIKEDTHNAHDHPVTKRPNIKLPTKKQAQENYEMFYVDRVRHKGIKLVERRFPSFRGWTEDKLKERQAIDVYGGPFGLGYVMVPLREVPSQTPKQYAKASNQNKEAPMQNPDWDDWNAHQNDDVLWEEYENRHKQAAANGCETFNENNDPKDMPGAGEQEEPDIEVDKQNGNPQASGAKDVVENLREMAQDLIETKLLFDTELKLALDKEPTNS
uniref:Uncharacterized protein n=1 Tax=Daucus carota subsp. sativus TaxID=79200 RepID=A0A175YGA4_DAUCS